mgnify:CR=1 FL=1
MEELIVNKLNILLLSFLLTACGNSTTEPKEQQEFKSLISSLSNEYKTAKNSDNDFQSKFEPFDQIITLREFKARQESRYLQWVLNQFGGNVTAAARKIDITPRQLFNKINEYGLKK